MRIHRNIKFLFDVYFKNRKILYYVDYNFDEIFLLCCINVVIFISEILKVMKARDNPPDNIRHENGNLP